MSEAAEWDAALAGAEAAAVSAVKGSGGRAFVDGAPCLVFGWIDVRSGRHQCPVLSLVRW